MSSYLRLLMTLPRLQRTLLVPSGHPRAAHNRPPADRGSNWGLDTDVRWCVGAARPHHPPLANAASTVYQSESGLGAPLAEGATWRPVHSRTLELCGDLRA